MSIPSRNPFPIVERYVSVDKDIPLFEEDTEENILQCLEMEEMKKAQKWLKKAYEILIVAEEELLLPDLYASGLNQLQSLQQALTSIHTISREIWSTALSLKQQEVDISLDVPLLLQKTKEYMSLKKQVHNRFQMHIQRIIECLQPQEVFFYGYILSYLIVYTEKIAHVREFEIPGKLKKLRSKLERVDRLIHEVALPLLKSQIQEGDIAFWDNERDKTLFSNPAFKEEETKLAKIKKWVGGYLPEGIDLGSFIGWFVGRYYHAGVSFFTQNSAEKGHDLCIVDCINVDAVKSENHSQGLHPDSYQARRLKKITFWNIFSKVWLRPNIGKLFVQDDINKIQMEPQGNISLEEAKGFLEALFKGAYSEIIEKSTDRSNVVELSLFKAMYATLPLKFKNSPPSEKTDISRKEQFCSEFVARLFARAIEEVEEVLNIKSPYSLRGSLTELTLPRGLFSSLQEVSDILLLGNSDD